MELPALLTDVGDAKTLHRHAAQGEVPAGREGEVLRIEPGGIVGQLLQARTGVRPPDADAAIVVGPFLDEDRPFPVLRHAAEVGGIPVAGVAARSEEHTSELQSLMRISYAVFCLKKKKTRFTHK